MRLFLHYRRTFCMSIIPFFLRNRYKETGHIDVKPLSPCPSLLYIKDGYLSIYFVRRMVSHFSDFSELFFVTREGNFFNTRLYDPVCNCIRF